MEPRPRKSSWPFYLAVVALLAIVPAAYFGFLAQPPLPPPPPPVEAPPKLETLQLGAIEGDVTIRRAGGDWAPAEEGAPLSSQDAVRTGAGGSAVLRGGDHYEVKLEGGTELSVQEITSSISRLMLGSGMATAKVRGQGGHLFEVRAEGTDAVAATRSGTFAISNNGKGTVAVGTQEGEVEFSGKGKVVIVRAGQQSVVQPGLAPSEPVAVPSSLLLKVNWPSARELNKRALVLSGQSEPGVRVEVAGKVVQTDERGHFQVPVSLSEGRNALEVRARSVGGLGAGAQREVKVDTTPPRMGIDPDLWKR
jgi:hypothetical protein